MIASFLKIMCVKPDPMVTAEGSSLCSMIKNNYSTERIVRYIGSNKKVLNDRDKNGMSALMHAIAKEREEIVVTLVSLGADVNVFDDCGWTPLMYAVRKGNSFVIRLLLKSKANVNSVSKKDKMSALHLACCLGNVGIAVTLVKKGADPNLKDHEDKIPVERLDGTENVDFYTDVLRDMGLLKNENEWTEEELF